MQRLNKLVLAGGVFQRLEILGALAEGVGHAVDGVEQDFLIPHESVLDMVDIPNEVVVMLSKLSLLTLDAMKSVEKSSDE